MRINLQQFAREARVDAVAVMAALSERAAADVTAYHTLYIPVGHYHLADLALPSRTTVLIDPGARVSLAEPGRSLFTAVNAELISIVGQGIIDGAGHAATAGHAAPPLLRFTGCQRLRIEGISLEAATGPTIALEQCRDVDIERVQLNATGDARAAGLHILGGSDIRLAYLHADTHGTTLHLAAGEGQTLQAVTVRDSAMRSGTLAIRLLAEGGRVGGIRFHQCHVHDTLQAVGATVRRGGKLIEVAFDECSFSGTVLVDGADGVIERLSVLALRVDAPVTLRHVAGVVVRGESGWMENAVLEKVDFPDRPTI